MKNNLKTLALGLCTLAGVFLIDAWGTVSQASSVFRQDYQTPALDLSGYKSPELRGAPQNRELSVAVAISGGGHRAGNFGAGVLSALEEITCGDHTRNGLQEVDYLSTVSGGGFAAATYLATLHDHMAANGSAAGYSLHKLLDDRNSPARRNLERGYHNRLARVFISLRSMGSLDRGDFLEQAFDQKVLGAENRGRSLVLGDVFIDTQRQATPSLPLWIANSTIYNNGSIFPAYPKAFLEYAVSGYTHNTKEHIIEKPEEVYAIPLSVGLVASASFPGVVPATTLTSSFDPQNPSLHLFDGGLADNLGITTALEILGQTGENRKALIVIDAYKGKREPFSSKKGSPTMVEIYNRSAGISLDARRIRHRREIEKTAGSDALAGQDLTVVYLAFDDLPKEIREQSRDVTTDFNISEEEQELLLQAGRQIVAMKKDELARALFGGDCRQATRGI